MLVFINQARVVYNSLSSFAIEIHHRQSKPHIMEGTIHHHVMHHLGARVHIVERCLLT